MLLYIIRHGDPDYSTDSLTPRGILQAEAVGKRVFDAKIDRIFSSPMGRAKQTAEPACRLLGLPCEIEEWAHEIPAAKYSAHYPKQGRDQTWGSIFVQNSHIMGNGGYDLSYGQTLDSPMFRGTGMEEARAYIEENGKAFLERLGYREENGAYRILRPNDDKIALFCHGAFARTWLSVLLRIPLHVMLSSFITSHTGVTVIQFENFENGWTAPRCLSYCDLSHLHVAGLDMRYNGTIEV